MKAGCWGKANKKNNYKYEKINFDLPIFSVGVCSVDWSSERKVKNFPANSVPAYKVNRSIMSYWMLANWFTNLTRRVAAGSGKRFKGEYYVHTVQTHCETHCPKFTKYIILYSSPFMNSRTLYAWGMHCIFDGVFCFMWRYN